MDCKRFLKRDKKIQDNDWKALTKKHSSKEMAPVVARLHTVGYTWKNKSFELIFWEKVKIFTVKRNTEYERK